MDGFDKMAREVRPYEKVKGDGQKIYDFYLKELCRYIEQSKSINPLFTKAREEFGQIPREEKQLPKIGIVGEIFVRGNPFSNNYLVKTLEELGCQVLLPPVSEWFFYTNFTRIRRTWLQKDLRSYFLNRIVDAYQNFEEHKVYRKLGLELEQDEEELLVYAAPYIHSSFEGEAILSVGKTIDFIKQGASGVINVMPFTCMPGNIVATIYKKIKEDFKDFPLLILSFDGLEHATDRIRLEAFVHQAKERLVR